MLVYNPPRGGGVRFCHDYGLKFLICVHDFLLLVIKKEALPLSLFAIVLFENHGFGDRRFPLLK